MNPAIAKYKVKKIYFSKEFSSNSYPDADPSDFHHEHAGRPKEKKGKRKFKLQREIDDYLTSIH